MEDDTFPCGKHRRTWDVSIIVRTYCKGTSYCEVTCVSFLLPSISFWTKNNNSCSNSATSDESTKTKAAEVLERRKAAALTHLRVFQFDEIRDQAKMKSKITEEESRNGKFHETLSFCSFTFHHCTCIIVHRSHHCLLYQCVQSSNDTNLQTVWIKRNSEELEVLWARHGVRVTAARSRSLGFASCYSCLTRSASSCYFTPASDYIEYTLYASEAVILNIKHIYIYTYLGTAILSSSIYAFILAWSRTSMN